MQNVMMEFSLTVKALRKSRHMTVRDLSRVSGRSISVLTLLENGRRLPSKMTVQAVAKALSTTEAQRVKLEEKLLFYLEKARMGSELSALKDKFEETPITKTKSMYPEFLERLQKDLSSLKDKKDILIPIEAKEALSNGRILLASEIIEIAQRIGQPPEDYLVLANYFPFKSPLKKEDLTKIGDIFRMIEELKEEELSRALAAIEEILQFFEKKQKDS